MAQDNFPQMPERYDVRTMRRFVRAVELALQRIRSNIGTTESTDGGAGGVHNDLTGRDAADCHPQGAITGLVDALADKADQTDVTDLNNRVAILESETVATLIQEIDDTGATNPEVLYIGKAQPGTAFSEPLWQIQRITIASDNDTSVRFAGGTTDFNQVWDNRTSLTYS